MEESIKKMEDRDNLQHSQRKQLRDQTIKHQLQAMKNSEKQIKKETRNNLAIKREYEMTQKLKEEQENNERLIQRLKEVKMKLQ